MSTPTPAIQGLSTPAFNEGYADYTLGNRPTFTVDSSNSFYTTKVSNLVISATTYTASTDPNNPFGSMVVEFSGTPDLSEVMVGNYLRITTCEDVENISDFKITAVDDGADTITVEARGGVTNASSSGAAETLPFFPAYTMFCTTETVGLAYVEEGEAGAAEDQLTVGTGLYGPFSEVTIATSGKVRLKLA